MTDVSRRPESPFAELNRAGLIAGIGLKSTASPGDLLALLDTCLARIDCRRADIVALATIRARCRHPALLTVADLLKIPVLALAPDRLAQVVPNPSHRVVDLAGLPSVAEAAALALGRLVVEKQRGAGLTCALAHYTPAGSSSASSAASTLSTSSAGP